MDRVVRQAGETLRIRSASRRTADLVDEALIGAPAADGPEDVVVEVERSRAPFPCRDAEPVTRGVARTAEGALLTNACGSGFDLWVRPGPQRLEVRARWRPPARDRAAAAVLRARAVLLARAVLTQYPALWWAGRRGRVPVHAAAAGLGAAVPLFVGPGGVGRSTLLAAAVREGAIAGSDNVSVCDGAAVHGVVEPVRTLGGTGRRTTHGRREHALAARAEALVPDRVVVLRRVPSGPARARPVDPASAAASLVAGTYAAGELRRYWPFAALLSLATGLGPAHPPVSEVAAELAALPTVELVLGPVPPPSPAALLASVPLADAAR